MRKNLTNVSDVFCATIAVRTYSGQTLSTYSEHCRICTCDDGSVWLGYGSDCHNPSDADELATKFLIMVACNGYMEHLDPAYLLDFYVPAEDIMSIEVDE